MKLDSGTLYRMNLQEADAAVDAADKEFTALQTAANAAKEALFDACANAVIAGRTADQLETRLKSNKTPEQIQAGLAFTATYIRKKIRIRGVAPLRSGPKTRKQASAE